MTIPDKTPLMPMQQHIHPEHHHTKTDSVHNTHENEYLHHSMTTLPVQKSILIIVVTFVGLLLVAWFTSAFLAPISF